MKALNIITDAFSLHKKGFPHQTGWGLIKITVTNIYYALLNLASPENDAPALEQKSSSEIWELYNLYLSFQIKYYHPRHLVYGPVIKSAAGGFLLKNQPYFDSDVAEQKHVLDIGHTMQDAFKIKNKDNLTKWLSRPLGFLYAFQDQNIPLQEQIKNLDVIEIGPGIGANVLLSEKLSPSNAMICFDLPEMLSVAKTFHRLYFEHQNKKTPDNFYYTSAVQELEKLVYNRPFCILSYWAFTEMPTAVREKFLSLIQKSSLTLFAANSVFEGVDNQKYMEDLSQKLTGKRYLSIPLNLKNMPNFMKKHKIHLIIKE